MTKDDLIALMDGLPGDTEVLLWSDRDQAFLDPEIAIEHLAFVELTEEAIGYPGSFWARPENVRMHQKAKMGQPVPVIVIR
jgi:hypothetical protein